MVDPVHRGNRMDHAKYYFDEYSFRFNRSHHLSCVRGILFYGLVKHAVAIDLHPRDLLSEKVDRQCLGKVPALCGFTAEGAQPGGLAGGFD